MCSPNTKRRSALKLGLLLAFIVSISCSDEEQVFEVAPYAVNQDLIAEAISIPEIGLQLSPPRGWQMLDSVRLDNFRRMLGGTDLSREFYPVFPLMAFSDTVTQCVMYVAQIEDTLAEFSAIVKAYDDFLAPRLTNVALTKSNYLINGLEVYHYMLHSEQVVNYKLLGEVSSGQRYLIEFILGGHIFATVEKAAVSSMASLSKAEGI